MIYLKPTNIDTYLNHARQNQLMVKYKSQKEMMELPICPKCERPGFRDKGWKEHKIMACPVCGYQGPTNMILKAYIKKGLYK